MADLTSNTDGLQEILDMMDSRVVDTSQFQPKDADLTAIAGLTGASGFLRKTAANTWALDTSTYLPLAGGEMSGPIDYTGKTQQILTFAKTDASWRGGLKYSWSGNTTIGLWGKHTNSQFVWHAGTDFSTADVNGTATRTYDFQIGRDARSGGSGNLEALLGGKPLATQDWISNNYLPKTGGTMTGHIWLGLDPEDDEPVSIKGPGGYDVLTVDTDDWPILGNINVPTIIQGEYLSLYNTGYVENARFSQSGFTCLGYDDEPNTNLCSIKYDAKEEALKFTFK